MSKESKNVAFCGLAIVEPSPASRSGGAKGNHESKSQVSYNDKQSGSYGRAIATEKATSGDFYWKNGTTGTRSEYKQTETVRVGDKSGYTEVYNEQRVRNVTYSNNYGSKNVVTYDNNPQGGAYGSGGAYGGSSGLYGGYGAGCDYDSDSDY